MGLLDVINGMQNGPRGSSQPSAQSGGGMSPLTMAILGLLAWMAEKYLAWSDRDGAGHSLVSDAAILDEVALYWMTDSIGSSVRLYYIHAASDEPLGQGLNTTTWHAPAVRR